MKKILIKIDGMHCTACAMDIDGELEETEGIVTSNTNYARQQTEVEFEPGKITTTKILTVIQNRGYQTCLIE